MDLRLTLACKGKEILKKFKKRNAKFGKTTSKNLYFCVRLKAMKSLQQTLLQTEDFVKVYEARLTERETTSLDPAEVQAYQNTLRVLHIQTCVSFSYDGLM